MLSKRVFHKNLGHMEDHKSGIVRSELYFCRTFKVPIREYKALLYGFQRIIEETGRQVTIQDYDNYTLGRGFYSSADWYQERALTKRERGYGIQTSAITIDSLLREEPFQKQNPHFDAMIVDKDLTTTEDDPVNNFIFGYGLYPNNIISVKRFMQWIKDPNLRQACLAILGAHEFAHNLDLVYRNYNIGKEGYKQGHCNGESVPCLMEQVNVPGAKNIDDQTRLLIDRNSWLCPDCTKEIQIKRDDLRNKGVYW